MKTINKLIRCLTLMALALWPGSIRAQSNTPPTVYFVIAVHSEEPGGAPTTPNFQTASVLTYDSWRRAILWFAEACRSNHLAWDFQSDYNFLEGIRRFETPTGTNYTPTLLRNGKNTVKYLHEDLGVELDPHCHEDGAYNYADVAYLLDIGCDTDASGVVGGHVYTGNGYQNWPKFITGLSGKLFTNYFWQPHLLMGGGTAAHRDDPHAAGMWRPAGTNTYLVEDPTGKLPAIANWEQDLHETDRLLTLLETGTLPHSNKLWTCGMVFNHRDMFGANTNKILAQLDTIRRWRDAGRFTVTNFESTLQVWTNAPYNATSSLYLRPTDNLSFSLNWQDFSYPADSISELRLLLNQHEASQVPVDVFLTTWQTDILETYAPELLGRLESSAWVNIGYHIRPPKPYSDSYVWTNVTASTITNYETHGLDLTNGAPTAASGGYAKLSNLMGFAPTIIGPNADTTNNIAQLVFNYFTNAGAGLFVEHRDVAVNLSDKHYNCYLRPESFDWKLIEYFRGSNDVSTIDKAFTIAHTNTGAVAPYFVGLKLHDNDLFATTSAWEYVYNSPSRTKNHWTDRPWNLLDKAAQLSADLRASRRQFYTNTVADAAARRPNLNLVDARDMLSLLALERPRAVAISLTEMQETTSAGGLVARLSGGGSMSGVACDYALVSGTGDANNSDFYIVGDGLYAGRILSYESGSVRQLRVRWTDGGGTTGERALTLVLTNITSDDDDGDGYTEAQETIAGTDPANAASALGLSAAAASSSFNLTFTSMPGRAYYLEHSTDLAHWSPVNTTALIATTNTTSIPIGLTNRQDYFRVRVTNP